MENSQIDFAARNVFALFFFFGGGGGGVNVTQNVSQMLAIIDFSRREITGKTLSARKNKSFKVNHQRPKFVIRRPDLKIPTLAKLLISPSVRVIIKICKKHLLLKTNSNINICNET